MKIAIVGTRGIPAKYGGFETCAEELSTGLVSKGHRILVTCRRYLYKDMPAEYKGVELRYPPSLRGKTTDTFSHTFFSIFNAILWSADVILVFNSANSPLVVLPRLLGKKVAINVDGLEWKRAKWSRAAKLYYKFAEFFSSVIANTVISDAVAIKEYYLRKYGRKSVFIPYGAHAIDSKSPEILERYRVKRDEYFFTASRLEPENHQDLSVKAFSDIKTDKFLVIAGAANWNSPYVREIKRTDDTRVKFLGPVYEPGHIEELHCNCYAYIHGNEVGGTNPALLKAMGCGNCIIALDVPFNREVLGNAGLYYKDADGLKDNIEFLLVNPQYVTEFREAARSRVMKLYRWEKVVEDYERVFAALAPSP